MAVKDALDFQGLRYRSSEDGTWFNLTFEGNRYLIDCSIYAGDTYVVAIAKLPIIISDNRKLAVLSVLNDLSASSPHCSYEIYPNTKNVQAKVGLLIPPDPDRGSILMALNIAFTGAETAAASVESALKSEI